jgi:hypothetical protein
MINTARKGPLDCGGDCDSRVPDEYKLPGNVYLYQEALKRVYVVPKVENPK